MAEYFTHIQEGSGEKAGQLISTVGATISGLAIAISVCPYYGLCISVYLPFATVVIKYFQRRVMGSVMVKFGMNARLGAFTEELFGALKLVVSFGRE